MDTIPFHFVMFALDLVLIFLIAVWPSQKSFGWGLGGMTLFSFLGIIGIGVIARLFKSNIGQCIVEGMTFHGAAFLIIAGCIIIAKRRRFMGFLSILFGLGIFCLGVYSLFWEPYTLVVENYHIVSSKVKKPIRIVFVADIQTDNIGNHERKTLELVKEQNGDLIIFGGDYLQYYDGTPGVETLPERFRQLFANAQLKAPLGVYAIVGNVDPSHPDFFNPLFKDTGVEPVFFSTIIDDLGVDKGHGPIDLVLLSLHDSYGEIGESALTDSGRFIVVAGHYPRYALEDFEKAPRAPDLMLAGHTHGGQISIPLYGPIKLDLNGSSFAPRDRMRGMFEFANGGHFLVSRGSGMERGWAPRIRFRCPPEISVIDVEPASKSSD